MASISGTTTMHYSGGLLVGSTTWLRGWPCCCSGHQAESIRTHDTMRLADRSELRLPAFSHQGEQAWVTSS